MNHILQSVIVEQPATYPFRIVLHKLAVGLSTHMEILEKDVAFDPDEGHEVDVHRHLSYIHGHYHDSEVDALCDFAMRCKNVNAKLDIDWK